MTDTPRVWIVDDDRSIRWVLEKALAGAAIEAASFADAESLMRSHVARAARNVVEAMRATLERGAEERPSVSA